MQPAASILLVDRSRVALMFQETVLRRGQNIVRSVTRGSEACIRVRSEQPRLVIFSYDLDDMTAPELCREIRGEAETRGTSLLFVAEKETFGHAEVCISAGCNDVLVRPFHWRELDAKVAKLTKIPIRRELRTLTRLEVTVENEGRYILGISINVSPGGMLLESEKILPPEARVTVSFFIPGAATAIRATASVVRAEFTGRRPRYGLRFLEITRQDQERIAGWVERLSSREAQ